MAILIYIPDYMSPRKGSIIREGYWYCNNPEERRIFVSIHPSFFKSNGTNKATALRHAISHYLEKVIHRVRKGITLVWTREEKDTYPFLKNRKAVFRQTRITMGNVFIRLMDWVSKYSKSKQRTMYYDPFNRKCVANRRSNKTTVLLYSPRLQELTYWEGSDSITGYNSKKPRSAGKSKRSR